MRSLELFSGCGGLALGTARAGFDHDLLVEWNANACATLEMNKAKGLEHARHWSIRQGDVRQMDWSAILRPIDMIAGGPPCQPFSIGGKHKGHDDARDMWPEAIRAVREISPSGFLFENVRGLAREAFSEYLAWITASLEKPSEVRHKGESHLEHLTRLRAHNGASEYQVIVLKINAADFGTAQERHRVVVAGIRQDLGVELLPPVATHSKERLLWDQWVSGEYWSRHGLKALGNEPTSEIDRRIVARLRKNGEPPESQPWQTVRDALAGLGDPTGIDGHVFQDGARVYPGHTGSPLDKPAKALKAGGHGVPGGENMMVKDDGSVRYFTIREAARLQGLPDDWSFATSWTESMRQLGNAMPVQMAEGVARWMANMLITSTAGNAMPVQMAEGVARWMANMLITSTAAQKAA
jgi:DNA (cytosine-5)-methyltransferase 1